MASALHAKAHQRGWCACARRRAPVQPVRLEAPGQAVSPLHAAARGRVRTPETRRAPRRRRSRRRRRAGARPLLHAADDRFQNRARARDAGGHGPARRRLGRRRRAGLQPATPARATPASSIMDLAARAAAALGHGPGARASLRRANAVLERRGTSRRRRHGRVDLASGCRHRRRRSGVADRPDLPGGESARTIAGRPY